MRCREKRQSGARNLVTEVGTSELSLHSVVTPLVNTASDGMVPKGIDVYCCPQETDVLAEGWLITAERQG